MGTKMTWQEYQEAVAQLYEQLDDLGSIHRSITIPDKVTGQPRQIDVLVEITAYNHTLRLVVDAKFHKDKIDVKDVEEVLALADAVHASQTVIVAANGWTEPAATKANFHNCSLRLLSLEDALDLVVGDKWEMCPNCHADCIVLDMDGVVEYGPGWLWWLAGRCRECKYGFVWCQDCGENVELPFEGDAFCGCGHSWHSSVDGLFVRFNALDEEE
ncbi:MAG: restriction endonuclease [Planctomycetaceae bacterium]